MEAKKGSLLIEPWAKLTQHCESNPSQGWAVGALSRAANFLGEQDIVEYGSVAPSQRKQPVVGGEKS